MSELESQRLVNPNWTFHIVYFEDSIFFVKLAKIDH